MMRALGFIAYATLATVLPALVVAWNMGAMAPFWFLAGDAYLYLGIGQSSEGLSMSFDSLRNTNGFHPLWQIWVRLMVSLTGSPLGALAVVAYSAIAFTLGGVLILGAAIHRFTGSWLLAMLAVPGAYFLIIGQALQNLPVWSFFDGMDGGMAFFFAACLAWLIAGVNGPDDPHRRWQYIGLTLAALVLTRLDEVFVPMALSIVVVFWPGRPLTRRIRDAAWLSGPSAIAVAVFVGWSYATTGHLAPVSGAAKGEGALFANSWVALATFFAPLIELREGLTSYQAAREALLGGAFRVVELIVPALFAVGFFTAILRRYRQAPWAPLLVGLCAGIIIKGVYNLAAVNFWHQASWYFALAMMVMTLGCAIILAPAVKRMSPSSVTLTACVLGGLTLLHASLWSATLMTDPTRPHQRDFWLDRGQIQTALLTLDPDVQIMEFGDGLLNYSFDFPVRHGFVFAGDAQSLSALRESRLLHDGYSDGFTVLSSFEYLRVPDGAEDWDSAQIRSFLMASFLDRRVKAELASFDFDMLYVHRPSGTPFVRFIPRQ